MSRRIKGGHKGYRRAVREAFKANIHNPAVTYASSLGFMVRSLLIPRNRDEFLVCEASYRATDGAPSMTGSRREYEKVRCRLIQDLQEREDNEILWVSAYRENEDGEWIFLRKWRSRRCNIDGGGRFAMLQDGTRCLMQCCNDLNVEVLAMVGTIANGKFVQE